MDKNTVIGLGLIFVLLLVWAQINSPTEAELAEQQRIQDSIELASKSIDKTAEIAPAEQLAKTENTTTTNQVLPDSVKELQMTSQYGPFAAAMTGSSEIVTLENSKVKISFDSKGGRITSVELNEYDKAVLNEAKEEIKTPLLLLEDEQNKFEYLLKVPSIQSGKVNTGDLYFKPSVAGNKLTMTADLGEGRTIAQEYTLKEDDYGIDYNLVLNGLNGVIPDGKDAIEMRWVNHLDKLEINTQYEKNYSSIYYHEKEEDPDNCSCTGDDLIELKEKTIEWVSHSNQFFNSTIMAKDKNFASGSVETVLVDEDSENLKTCKTNLFIPHEGGNASSFAMEWYIGPNEYNRLASYDNSMEDIIPFGWSIFGTINRWIIRPLFTTLSKYIGSAGIVILLLTFVVKMVLYPLTYKMIHSQSKMAALKPQIAALKEKNKDKPQEQQMETMKLYREFGVNPLGGCMPMVLQMPIWFALYRFFPAAIEFRQASFLWATDLSSYDVIARIPEIPFYGAHISLFTLLWAGTTVLYAWYNSKLVDMSNGNPMMKYMQYFMPIMFLFFFNNFASGLTCYLFFSNLFNILQTLITKNYVINQDKIKQELADYKKKPKKKGGFQERLANAMAEQQKAAEAAKKKAKKK